MRAPATRVATSESLTLASIGQNSKLTRVWQSASSARLCAGERPDVNFRQIACDLEIRRLCITHTRQALPWVLFARESLSRSLSRLEKTPHPHYRHCVCIDQSSFDCAKCSIELQRRRRHWRLFTPFHAPRQTYALSTIACVIRYVEPDAIRLYRIFLELNFNFQRLHRTLSAYCYFNKW